MNHTGQKLKELRETLGWTQSEFANILGVAPGTVASWESKGIAPDGRVMQKIVNIFKINPRLLYKLPLRQKAKAETR